MSTDVQHAAAVAVAELREVHGPSALGGGSRRFFDLLKLISVTEFKRVYFGTVLGYLWSLIRPLMLFGVLLLVFTQVFRVGSDKVEHYPVFLLMGIVLYTFFSESTSNAVTSVVSQEGVVRKTQFPRAVIPLATSVTGALQPAAEPDHRARLHPRLRRHPGLDLVPLPGRARRPLRRRGGVVDGALGALRALPRHRDHLGRPRPGAALPDADPLPGQLLRRRNRKSTC